MPKMPKRVRVEEAENGYIVSGMDEKGHEKQMVRKNMDEVMEVMGEMMGKMGMKGGKKMEKMHEKKTKSGTKYTMS